MLALRSFQGPDDVPNAYRRDATPVPVPADWLSLQQAACELGVSISTARRMIRKGRLRNRIVPRRGGFAYLIYLPNSRHAGALGGHAREDAGAPVTRLTLVPLAPTTDATPTATGASGAAPDDEVRVLRAQVEHLSEALSRALRIKQKSLPAGMGAPVADGDPYSRYRWLVRRHWWWPF